MSNTRNIIDFAYNDQGSEMRDALYAEIHDRVMSHIEAKKQELAQSILSQEETEKEEGHEDEKEDKALVKKMVKKDCLTKEGIDDNEDEWDEEEDDEEDEWDDETVKR